MSGPSDQPKRILGEATLVLLLSAATYLLALRYEQGFAAYFGIPQELVSLDLQGLLLFGGAGVGVVFGLLLLVNLLVMVFPAGAHPALKRALRAVLLASIACIVPIAIYGIDRPDKWWWLLLFWGPSLYFELLHPVFAAKGVRGYSNKLAAIQDADDKTPDLARVAAARFGIGPVLAVSVFAFGVVLARMGGEATAMKKTRFLVQDSKPPRVVLCKYGDMVILASADLDKHLVAPDFLLAKVGEEPLRVTLQEIGPLRPLLPPPNTQISKAPTHTPIPPTRAP